MDRIGRVIGVLILSAFLNTAMADGAWRVQNPALSDDAIGEAKPPTHTRSTRVDMRTLEYVDVHLDDFPRGVQSFASTQNPFIVGGSNASSNAYPEYGSIWLDGLDGYLYLICGGTLLNSYQALTAAHCVDEYSAYRYYFVPKTHRLSTLETADFVSVYEKKIHPQYDDGAGFLNNDIAILDIALFDTNFPTAKLISTDASLADFEATAVGLGRLSTEGSSPNILQEVSVGIVDNAICQKANENNITDAMICAGTEGGGKDVCSGDSGGPLFVEIDQQRLQVGITSWGVDGCAKRGRYGVYARISALLDFVERYAYSVSVVEYIPPAEDDILDLLIPLLGSQQTLLPPAEKETTCVEVYRSNCPEKGNHNYLFYSSDPGDYIGGGQTRLLSASDRKTNEFSLNYYQQSAWSPERIHFGYATHWDYETYVWWDLDISPPMHETLAIGTYTDAQRIPFQDESHSGLDFGGSGRGCNRLSGSFTIYEMIKTAAGEISQLAVNFTQHCENATPKLFGVLRYNSAVPMFP